jgi:protein-tyrosine phosphatase
MKLKPIIAHIERFIDYQKGTSYISDLLGLDVLVQMNGEYVNGFFTRGKAIKLIESNVVQLIGSDCHNMDKRSPNLDKTFTIIEKKLGKKYIDKLNNLGYNIIS